MNQIEIAGGTDAERAAIHELLSRSFGETLLKIAGDARIRIVLLDPGEEYAAASSALSRLGINVDAWPVPPAGLFVVDERAVYLRSRSPMTVAHEFGHAIDCALGKGVYRSGIDPAIRAAFAAATSFVTPYAAVGLDEYFAESLRAFVGVNDAAARWPKVSRAVLRRKDPTMHALLSAIVEGAK